MIKKIFGILTRIKNTTKKNRILILGFFLVTFISFGLRFSFFVRPIVNNEWNSATILRHLEIWDQTSAFDYDFNPVTTYQSGADKFINNHASNQSNILAYLGSDNNYYYTTYPQFGYIAPYLFFKILFVEPNLIGLRFFSLLIYVLISLFVYKILTNISKEKTVGFIGFVACMFQAISLNHYPNNYMSDMLVPLFFMSTVYWFIKIVTEKKYSKTTTVFWGISMSLMVYTEYLGLFVAGVMLLYALYYRNKSFARIVIWTSVLVPALTMFFIAFQFSLVGNLQSFLAVMVNRYSDSYMPYSNIVAIKKIINQYERWYIPSITLIVVAIGLRSLIFLITKQDGIKIDSQTKTKIKALLIVTIIPVLMHHVIMLNWTAFHAVTFGILKSASIFALGIGLSVWLLLYKTKIYNKQKFSIIILVIFLLSLCWSWNIYKKSIYIDYRQYSFCDAGKKIAEYSESDQIIFVKDYRLKQHNFPIDPVIVYCAKRNIEIYTNKYEANELMKKNNTLSGVIFTLSYSDKEGVNILKVESTKVSK